MKRRHHCQDMPRRELCAENDGNCGTQRSVHPDLKVSRLMHVRFSWCWTVNARRLLFRPGTYSDKQAAAMLSRRCLELACPRLTSQLSASRNFNCSQSLSGIGCQMNDEDPALLEAELKRYKKGEMVLT